MFSKAPTGMICGLITFFICQLFDYPNEIVKSPIHLAIVAGVGVCCIVWWITEVVPVGVTSLLPLAIFPLFGVLTNAQVAGSYGSPLVLLLLGGFLLSKGIEASGTHKKLALVVFKFVGYQSPRRLVFALMITTAILSMWISNTATVLMMMPIVMTILQRINLSAYNLPVLLGLAYSASIGGMGTPVGSPPNLEMIAIYEQFSGNHIDFLTWMTWALPVVFILLPLTCWWITRQLPKSIEQKEDFKDLASPWNSASIKVLIVFLLTVIAWITRNGPYGGWSELMNLPYAKDYHVAFLAVITLFLLNDSKGKKIMNWEHAVTIPWGIIILFGGGIALARGFQYSGLSGIIGNFLTEGTQIPVFLLILILCLGTTFLTETTSNTATTVLLMPILAVVGQQNALPLEILMLPVCLSASCAFMLPVATAPNAIVFSSKMFKVKDMVKVGLILNLIGGIVISAWAYLVLYIF